MNKLEKVKLGLKCCSNDEKICEDCPYVGDEDEWDVECVTNLIKDALDIVTEFGGTK